MVATKTRLIPAETQGGKHYGRPAVYTAKVTGNFKDCLSWQVAEGAEIRRYAANMMITSSEWHQPPIWGFQSAIFSKKKSIFGSLRALTPLNSCTAEGTSTQPSFYFFMLNWVVFLLHGGPVGVQGVGGG